MINAILAVTGSDYTKYVGGTNKLILSHQQNLIEHGFTYVCIFPYRIFDRNKERINNNWCVRVNGKLSAVVHINEISDCLASKNICINELHIHQLLNISFNSADKLLSTFDTRVKKVFLHDYQFICKNYLMLRNDEVFCGTEPPNEGKCAKCKYCNATKALYNHTQSLFHKYRDSIEMVAPSKFVEDFYRRCFPDLKVITVPHQVSVGQYHRPLNKNSNIKVAFIGYANKTKGWEEFEKAIKDSDDDRIVYMHYGKGGESNKSITHVIVDTARDPDDMVDSLRRDQIDICVLWSIVPETYSYTYNECTMAGAYILTNIRSGNIAESVKQNKTGSVLNDTDELRALITNYEELNNCRNQCSYIAPLSFVDNDWIFRNVDKNKGVKSLDHKKYYDHIALKVLYLLKWMVKGK